jgi:hypothetical protein
MVEAIANSSNSHRKVVPRPQKAKKALPLVKKSKQRGDRLKCEFEHAYSETHLIDSSKPQGSRESVRILHELIFMLPVVTLKEIDSGEKWQVRYARHKMQKSSCHLFFLKALQLEKGKVPNKIISITFPCTVKLTRYAPRLLDEHDNLRVSLKYILDTLCAEISGEHRPGLADANKGFTFAYAQEKSSKYGVKVILTF